MKQEDFLYKTDFHTSAPTKKDSPKLHIQLIIRTFAPLSRNRCQEKQREAWYVAL